MHDTLPMFGDFLQSIIAEKQLTQREVARAVQINEKTLSAYIQGERVPPLDVAYRLSKHLNFSLDALLCPDDLTNVSQTPDEELVERVMDYCMQGGSLYAVNKFTPLFKAVLERTYYLTNSDLNEYQPDTDAHRMVQKNTEIFGHVLAVLKCLISMIEMDKGTQWEKEREKRYDENFNRLLNGELIPPVNPSAQLPRIPKGQTVGDVLMEMLGGIKK